MPIYEAIRDSQYAGRYRFKGKFYRFDEDPPEHIFRRVPDAAPAPVAPTVIEVEGEAEPAVVSTTREEVKPPAEPVANDGEEVEVPAMEPVIEEVVPKRARRGRTKS